jgi:sortase (surface protein transpeptidase)
MPARARSRHHLGAFLLVFSLVVGAAPSSVVALEPSLVQAPARRADAVHTVPGGTAPMATFERATGGRRAAMLRHQGMSPAMLAALGRAATDKVEAEQPPARETRGADRPKAEKSSKEQAPTKHRYRGRNHVWIPALGIDRRISFFSCSRATYPGNRVYRWGCAGSNNVYLFGHAHSVFKPLHDAYVRGRLRKGMKVYYANAKGRVSTYSVRWWRVTTPDKGEFAYAGQKRPSLTLQTCVGKRSQYRLIVRLVKV